MKYIKLFEQVEDKPKLLDYVQVDSVQFKELKDFFDNEIGRIVKVNLNDSYAYNVKFDKYIPNSSYGPSDIMMAYKIDELLAWAPDKELLKIAINAKKYNI